MGGEWRTSLEQHYLSPMNRQLREVQLDGSTVHFPMRSSDFDVWTVEKRLQHGLFHLSLTALRDLPAMKADQPDNSEVFNAG